MLKSMGISDPLSFEFLDRPSEQSMIDALKQLYYLGAIDRDGQITQLGKDMVQFPLEPQVSAAASHVHARWIRLYLCMHLHLIAVKVAPHLDGAGL